MNRTDKLLYTLVILLLGNILFAQETKTIRDLGLWTGVVIEKSVGKKWTFSLREEVRFKNDISELYKYFTELGIEYRINRNFSLEGNYRYIKDRNDEERFENRSRYNFGLEYKGKLAFITLVYRLKYQKEVEGLKIYDMREPYEKYLRNRITLRYNKLRKLEPFLSGELFQLFELYQLPRYHFVQMQAGISYEPGKIGKFIGAYAINHELKSSSPSTFFVIKIRYTYSF